MEENLKLALTEIGMPFYFLSYPQNSETDFIIYNYIENKSLYSDGDEDIINYTIYLNLYCDSGLKKKRNLIKKIMKKYGFLKNSIPAPYELEKSNREIINQAFSYNFYEKVEEI